VTGEPDPAAARTPEEFVACLRELRTWTGQPSLRRLQRLGGQVESVGGDEVDALPASTVSHVLTGKGLPALPRMAFVDSFVTACLTACDMPDDEVASRLARWRAAWRALAGAEPDQAACRQLPMDIREFTGRDAELAELCALVESADAERAVPVVVIEGMGGVGKTRLAVHAAHELVRAGRFGDFQLWSDLRGFDPHQPPAAAADVLEAFLRLLGVPGQAIPRNVAERSMLYRDRLAGRRGLVLLDNVSEVDQVAPLLPGGPGCLVLVTTRRSLPGLDGARHLPLDVFTQAEATELLARVAGADRVAAEPDGALRVAEHCGFLPLPLALAARRLHTRPAWRLADLADRLAGHETDASFALSYQSTAPEEQRMFRLLGSHPGTDLTVASAAALADLPLERAGAMLERLLDDHLLVQQTAGRYRFHDLLRRYAAGLPDSERAPALRRCLTWLLHTADNAVQTLEPHRRRVFTLSTVESSVPAAEFATDAEALAWCEAEHANLVAAVHAAADARLTTLAWQLPAVLLRYFYRRSLWADWVDTHRIALAAVRESGDRRGEATVLNGLGVAYGDLRMVREAVECCTAAAELFGELGDEWGQAWSLNNVGVTSVNHGDHGEAVGHLRRALELFRRSGDPQGEAICLNNLGDTYRLLHRPAEAIDHLRQALALQRDADEAGARYTLGTLGDVCADDARHTDALGYYEQALAAHLAVGDRRGAGRVRQRLGRTLAALGRDRDAAEQLRHARAVLAELHDPELAELDPR
jgi:tetratricopeptide (TPR) repeat protein